MKAKKITNFNPQLAIFDAKKGADVMHSLVGMEYL